MNEQPPDHFQTDLSVGEILRRTRLHYSQTLPDIERSLRIRTSQLEALENGQYEQLPGRVYVIGFIRSYSDYLGLDGEKMVQLYKTQTAGKPAAPTKQKNFAVQADDTKSPHSWQIIVSIIAVVAVIVIWMSSQKQDRTLVTEVPAVSANAAQIDEPKPAVAAPTVAPVSVASETAAAPIVEGEPPQPAPVENVPDAVGAEIEAAIGGTAAGGETPAPAETAPEAVAETRDAVPSETASAPAKKDGIILNIKKNSWVEIRGQDGKAIVSRVLKAGDRYFVPARADLTISLGNSGGVELEVEGKKLKPLGADGEVKRNIPLDAASLKKNYGQ
jgi:cytoskeleton protein RodZ